MDVNKLRTQILARLADREYNTVARYGLLRADFRAIRGEIEDIDDKLGIMQLANERGYKHHLVAIHKSLLRDSIIHIEIRTLERGLDHSDTALDRIIGVYAANEYPYVALYDYDIHGRHLRRGLCY